MIVGPLIERDRVVRHAISLRAALNVRLPPGPPPVVTLNMRAPSIWMFEAMSCTSALGSVPEFDVTIELPGLSEIISGKQGSERC